MKARISKDWQEQPPKAKVISKELEDKIARIVKQLNS